MLMVFTKSSDVMVGGKRRGKFVAAAGDRLNWACRVAAVSSLWLIITLASVLSWSIV